MVSAPSSISSDESTRAAEIQELSEYFKRLEFLADFEWGIPEQCPCGAKLVPEHTHVPRNRAYFTCQAYKPDGLHRRESWDSAIETECRMLRFEVEELKKKLAAQNVELEENKALVAKLLAEEQIQLLWTKMHEQEEEIKKLQVLVKAIFGFD